MDQQRRDLAQSDRASASWSAELQATYEASYESFVRMATVLIGRRSEAEEVVQDAFVSVAGRTAEIDNVGAYVRRSVINGAYGILRGRRVVDRHPVDPPPAEAPMQLVEFRDVLLRLPWNQRKVIILRFLEGLSVKETADIVGCRESTVRSHSRRGLKALRKELIQ